LGALVHIGPQPQILELLQALSSRLCSLLLMRLATLQHVMLFLLALEACTIIEHSVDLLGMHIRFRLVLPEWHGCGTEGGLTGAAEIQTFHHRWDFFLSNVPKHIQTRTNGS
jgi:hypothetical protein